MVAIADRLAMAAREGPLLESSLRNIQLTLNRPACEAWERDSIAELVAGGHWTELNDRFYRTLEFGTGGLRGRTIGKVVTRAEQGNGTVEMPQYPAVGTNAMNFFSVAVATRGLMNYLLRQFPGLGVRVAISFDTRLFSPDFARLCAEVIAAHGGEAYLFGEVRPTPVLSFAVRTLGAQAGIMITASHNPPHDNGYKVYFDDGAQVIEPHASAIIESVLAAQRGETAGAAPAPGRTARIGADLDDAYIARLKELILQPDVMAEQGRRLKVVYTPIHGTGVTVVPRLLKEAGVDLLVVPEQATCDGRFPTVKSPNPENREALSLGVKLADRENADAVIATDPDCDRMGVAVRNAQSEFEYLNGNQIGSLIADYRLEQLFAGGMLTPANAGHAALIKTFVTTDLMRSIAESYGARCVETLTGFKYIGAKLKYYEELAGGRGGRSAADWRDTLLRRSTYSVFAAEESYGYLAEDYVRDKDAAGAALEFVELLAFARHNRTTVPEILSRMYLKHGYYGERLGTLTFEGKEGAAKIAALLASYKSEPPAEWAGRAVLKIQNFAEEEILDADGQPLPRELMLTIHLAGGARVTTRASGTEPKIKFYFFAAARSASLEALAGTKKEVDGALESLWTFTRADVERRIAATH